ncbi:phosphate-selective porin O/P [Balneicella halophila]|uniref:Phosphate-selective porin O/P n=1 Tax=Balneicella halophila TaxID=1537566 RepID=A0A7L4UP32_BALHA|nr:porin [Balneicella halophila]PVX50868.1 phosphate-selective porin O/P [Balneicella halophila]
MKKTIILIILTLGFTGIIRAQQNSEGKNVTSLAERFDLVEKKSDKMDVYFNFQSSFDVADEGTEDWGAKFKARQLRLEIRGNLTDKLFYRFRHRLNRSNEARTIDNLSKATDILYAGYHFSDKFTIIAGKQCQAWGGFEFDLNPINIYEYSDMIEYMDNFMLGASFVFTPVENQEFILQITDSRNDSFEEIYGNDIITKQGFEESKAPLTYILNWNGSLFEDLIKTRWAIGVQTEAKDTYTTSISLGTKLNLPQFQLAFDYMRDDCELDRSGLASSFSPDGRYFEDVTYNSFIMKAEYQPNPKWNIFAKGMYENASVDNVTNYDDNFRKSYGYFGGVEYLPFEDQDLRVFLTYVGRKYDFDDNLAFSDYDTNRVSLGIIYRIKAF